MRNEQGMTARPVKLWYDPRRPERAAEKTMIGTKQCARCQRAEVETFLRDAFRHSLDEAKAMHGRFKRILGERRRAKRTARASTPSGEEKP